MNIWDVCSFILGVITIVFAVAMALIILLAIALGVVQSYRKVFPKKAKDQLEFDIAAKEKSLELHHDSLEAAFIYGANWSKGYHEGR